MEATAKDRFSDKPLLRPTLALAATALLVGGGVIAYQLSQSPAPSQQEQAAALLSQVKTVTALGRLEPQGEIVQLTAPSASVFPRVEELLVATGDRVEAGQIVAILDNRDRLQAALKQAEARVETARAKLEQVYAGAKTGDIRAQEARFERARAELEGQIRAQQAAVASLKAQMQGEISATSATIDRLAAELENAQTECDRYQSLYADGAVSASQRDSFCLQAATARERLAEARANLNRIATSRQEQINEALANLERTRRTLERQIVENKAALEAIAEVRPADLRVAQAELNSALADVEKAQADLEQAYARSPINGRVLEIHTRPGEPISADGIAELGQTDQMYAIAEVYQSDIHKVQLGQQATITSEVLTETLHGSIDRIGWQVQRQNVINSDPAANIDARVVEVWVLLDEASSKKAERFANLQVTVEIEL